MYSIAVLIFVVIFSGVTLLSGSPAMFIDLPSLVLVLGFSIPMVLASGGGKDLGVAFKIAMSSRNVFSELILKKALISLQLFQKLVLLSGLTGSLMGCIAYSLQIRETVEWTGFAVAGLATLYSALILLFLMPIEAKIKLYLTLEE